MEANEISEFSKEMQESGEANLRSVSLIISVLAVLVAMVTVLGHRTHTEAVLMQARASDTWNEYQAKKIRQGQISAASDLLSLQPNANQAAVEKRLSDYRAHIQKWNADLAQEQDQAHEFEAEVAKSERRASRYDLGEALLQIAVVLSSITLFTRQRLYVALGALIGVAGLITAASALLVR
jgi:hypothetical protein